MQEKQYEYMSYEEYLVKVKQGIVTRDGNCPVTPLLLMLRVNGNRRSCMRCVSTIPSASDS